MKIENAPALELDKVLYDNRGKTIPVHVVRERRIVWNLLKHLEAHDITPYKVDDGEEVTNTRSKKAVMEVLFNLDQAHVVFNNGAGFKRWIFFVLGNDMDIISDYSVGLEPVISKFNPEAYA